MTYSDVPTADLIEARIDANVGETDPVGTFADTEYGWTALVTLLREIGLAIESRIVDLENVTVGEINASDVTYDVTHDVAEAITQALGRIVDTTDPDNLPTVRVGPLTDPNSDAPFVAASAEKDIYISADGAGGWICVDDDGTGTIPPAFTVNAEDIVGTVPDGSLPATITRDAEMLAAVTAEVAAQIEDVTLTPEQIAGIESLNDFLADNPDLETALDAKVDEAAFTADNQVLIRTLGTIAGAPYATLAATAAFSDLYGPRHLTTTTSTNYTLSATHRGTHVIEISGTTVTVPAGLTAAPTGSFWVLSQEGAAPFTVTPAVGVTLTSFNNDRTSAGQYSQVVVRKRGTDNYRATGQLVP